MASYSKRHAPSLFVRLIAERPCNMLVYLRDGSALTSFHAATLRFAVCQTWSQYTDTGPTSPSTDPIMPGAWQGSHWNAIFLSHWYDSTQKILHKRDSNRRSSTLEVDALSTRPMRRSCARGSVVRLVYLVSLGSAVTG